MKLPFHEGTTVQLAAAYPLVSSPVLPTSKVLVGRDLYGGAFAHDPFELYAAGLLTNPNMLVIGQIGRGKSAFVKTYCYRQAAFGRRIVVLDPKGEYGPLAEALGAVPVRLRPGGRLRLNPLDVGGGADAPRRRLSVLAGIGGAVLGRALRPVEHTALELALSDLTGPPILPAVVEALLHPRPARAAEVGESASGLRRDARDLALELRRFVHGEHGGMFDGPTSSGIDLLAPVVVLDLAAVYGSESLGALIVCANAALERSWSMASTGQTILVVDEAWAVLGNLGAARFLQSSWKLARARGVANVAVVHRCSDLASAGEAGSVGQRIAQGLLADCETLVCYAQAPGEVTAASRLLGLGGTESRLLPRLGRAVALWRVADRRFLVEHRLAPGERAIIDTDRRLIDPA